MATQFAPVPRDDAYETDAFAWAMQQGARLRARQFAGVDWDNVAEEIETMGRSERSEIESRLDVIIEHLIKLAVSRDVGPRAGWWNSVLTQRLRVERKLAQNPSLRRRMAEMFADAWPIGARMAAGGLRADEAPDALAAPWLTPEQAMAITDDAELRALATRA